MANEITVSSRLKVTNGNLKFEYNSGNLTFDQAAAGGPTPGFLTIGTTEESVAFGELGTLGWVIMRNLDATNYVQWGFATTAYGGRMEAGETVGPFRLEPSTTLYLKANTAACQVLIYALED
jgi:hypothetical protein